MYWKQLIKHISDPSKLFGKEFIYPRQFEIHLPANHKKSCDLACPHCAGRKFDKTLGSWEMDALELLDKLQGKIPFHIYGGAYTEPLMNPYFMTFLAMTKKHNNHFGIHTNGVLLDKLENGQGFLTELNRISTDKIDYLSISIDAGLPRDWAKTKGANREKLFLDIISGIRRAAMIRKKSGNGHAIRLCYLISKYSGNTENFSSIVDIAKDTGVDSLRFSIPFAVYNQTFDKVKEYKNNVEIPGTAIYEELLEPYLSKSKDEKPYVFYTGPEFTDIDKFSLIKMCAYGYYQITYGADGYVYKCSTTATPTMKQCRLGRATRDLNEFNKMVVANQNKYWDCDNCFARGARCNRMGLEINVAASEHNGRSA